jgi:hypothetical protein
MTDKSGQMRRYSLFTSASCSCISTTMSVPLDPGLRQRTPHLKADQVPVSSQSANGDHAPARDQVVWGQTPSGQGAHVPEHTLHLLVDTCLPQFSASRPHTMSSPPSSIRPTQNHTSTSSTSACSLSSSSSSTPCQARPARYSSFSISRSGAPRTTLGLATC